MPNITFDGPNKIIDVGYDAGTTIVRATDLYSRWKDWVKDGNAQWPEAFAGSVGGDDLGSGVKLDAYIFIRNDLGWRVRAADIDHKLIIDGQLYGFSPSTAVVVSRPGRTITYELTLSSRSQVINPAADTVSASGSYQGRVWLNPTSMYSDTNFPTGTSVQPANNMAAAVQIANTYGLREIFVLGNLTLAENVSGFAIVGANAGVQIVVDQVANVLDTVFDGVNVTGYFDGPARIRNGTIDELIDGFVGEIDNCHILTGIRCIGDVNIHRCSSGIPWQGGPFLDMMGAVHACQVREWTGTIEIRNMVAGATMSVDINAGRLVIHSSCTGGSIKVRGVGEPIEDNSGLVTIDDDGFLTTTREVLMTKILRNKRVTDPLTGTQTIFDDDNTTVLLDGPLWEDAGGTIPYQGQGAERADRLT